MATRSGLELVMVVPDGADVLFAGDNCYVCHPDFLPRVIPVDEVKSLCTKAPTVKQLMGLGRPMESPFPGKVCGGGYAWFSTSPNTTFGTIEIEY
ncbi:hypothetical protein MAUB1S_11476 [Mycolicibacterium aubagnense]